MPMVFISHSSDDKHFVSHELLTLLKRHEIDTWYSHDSIPTAKQWERMIVTGLKACDWFLLVMSPRSAKSSWVKAEVDWAIENRKDHIVPVLLEVCDPTDFHLMMRSIQHVDFTDDVEHAREQLLQIWNIQYLSNLQRGAVELPPLKMPQREIPETFRRTYRTCVKMLGKHPDRRLLESLNNFIDAINNSDSLDDLNEIGDSLQESYFRLTLESESDV